MQKQLLLLLLFIGLNHQVSAQGGWQQIYPMFSGGPHGDGIDAVRQTPDGGYILAGVSEHNSGASQNRVAKVNDQGTLQWSYSYANVGNYSWATNVELAAGGGFYVEGRRINPVSFQYEIYHQKLDNNGIQQWIKFYDEANIATKGSTTQDGGYVSIGYFDNNNIQDTIVLIKTDASGNTALLKKYPNQGTGIERLPHSIIETANGDYVIEGYKDTGFGGLCFLWRVAANGDLLWQNTYGNYSNHPEYIGKVIENADGTLAAVGNDRTNQGANEVFVYKTSADGDLIWSRKISQNNSFGTDLAACADGGYIITGYDQGNTSPRILLIKLNAAGEQQWLKVYTGDGTGNWKAYSVRQTIDGGYIVGGAKVSSFYTRRNMYLIKTDDLGEIYSNTLQGYVYFDENENCDIDTQEHRFQHWIVKASGNQTFLTSTDENGYYWMRVDTGNYVLTLHPASNNLYWEMASCAADSVVISILNQMTTINTSFAQTAEVFCPLLNVDMAVPFLRRCFSNTYAIHYCNSGTAAADNAYIEIAFDDFLEINEQNISVPFTALGDNVYRFELGEVNIDVCGSFLIEVLVSCDAELGQTHCSRADIYPNLSCLIPVWEGAYITLDATCTADSVEFEIFNAGQTMTEPRSYTSYWDGLIYESATFMLQSGESITVSYPANQGITYRLEAQQEVGFPSILGDSLVAINVEGCGGIESSGTITQFANYDGSPFFDIDCRVNIGAYDPNDKSASPEGYGAQHFIYANTDLDYLIRFQNTGTDTAFTVIIRDTIAEQLDITTLQAGSSSHPYSWRIYGENAQAIEFTFNNIMLPDSFINEPASNGFVKFKIKQKAGNPIGTIIQNTAAIYFDFNEPIFTNTTFHEIGTNFIPDVVLSALEDQSVFSSQVLVYPNPFHTFTNISFEPKGQQTETYVLQVFDATGRMVQIMRSAEPIFRISSEDMSAGLYFYRIDAAGKHLHQGKLILN